MSQGEDVLTKRHVRDFTEAGMQKSSLGEWTFLGVHN